MSNNTERKRHLTRLRVQKHRAIRKELLNEDLGSCDVQDPNTNNVNERVEYFTPGGERTEDTIDAVDSEQPSEAAHPDTTSNDDNPVDDTGEPLADLERCSSNDNNDADSPNDSHSENNDTYDSGGTDEQCNNEVEEIRKWAIRSNISCAALDNLLKILRKRLLPQIPKSSKTFLETSLAKYNITEMEDCSGESGQFVYIGIAAGLRKCINEKLHEIGSTLQLQFNIDGMPLAKSSFSQVWPILCKVFYKPDIYAPFPVAIYCGPSKPKCLETYLGKFIEEMNILSERGIEIDGKRLEVCIHSFICDTPARAMLKCTKGHTGFYACERCNVQGLKINQTTVFPSINSQERTDETFRNRDHPEHHNLGHCALLLLRPPIDMIKLFILDSMHLKSGVMKKLISYWVSGKLPLRLSYHDRSKLSARLEYLKSFVPCEFQGKPRAVKYTAKWKATELRFFLLYCGPIVFKGILRENLYNHFLLFHVASRILCSSELALKRNKYAKTYLNHFFLLLKEFYGPDSQVMNTHNLIHVADDAVNMQCELSRISAFPFENVLGTVIKKCIRTQNRPLAQICRRLHEQKTVHEKVILRPIIEILKSERNGTDPANCGVLKIKFKGFVLSKNAPDNKVILTTGEILKIDKMYYTANNINNMTISGSVWKIKRSIFSYPCDSRHLKMWELTNKPSSTKISCNVHRISNKMMMLALPNVKYHNGNVIRYDKKFIMPYLHS